MSEKTLKEISDEAQTHYSNHRVRTNELKGSEFIVKQANRHFWRTYSPASTQEESKQNAMKQASDSRQKYDEDLQRSAEFAGRNAEQLHDLAVAEAHLGGIAINVEQPDVDDQKIEVHVEK